MRFFLITAAMVVFAPMSFAYTPQYTDTNNKTVLRWEEREISIGISRSYLEANLDRVSRQRFVALVRDSFDKWSREADITIRFTIVDETDVSGSDSGGDGVSLITIAPTPANLEVFDKSSFSRSAVTRIFFDEDGRISEADIVLNPTVLFSTSGRRGTFDLESTLTHEVGHLLGLGHSKIPGATMHRHQFRNGTVGGVFQYPRSLSADDLAGIRHLYGPSNEREFGSVEGRVYSAQKDTWHFWIESVNTGAVAAGISSAEDGTFNFPSIPADSYMLYGRTLSGTNQNTRPLRFEVVRGDTVKLELEPTDYLIAGNEVIYGRNGQLSDIALSFTDTGVYTLFMSGEELKPDELALRFNTPFIEFVPGSISTNPSRAGNKVFSFQIRISEGIPSGSYSIELFEGGRLINRSPGILVVEEKGKAS